MEKFNLNNVSKFEYVKPVNSEFSLFKCWVAGIGTNRNMSYISKERMDNALPTLSYAPVVAHLIQNEDGSYRLGSHDAEFDMETWEFVPLTVPVGVVIADSFSYETVNEYGTDVEYLCADVILWTGRYPQLFDCQYSDDIFCAQSMELSVTQYRVWAEDSNYTELLDFSFSALCLLGKSDDPQLNNEPCFISSRLAPINFSSNDFVAKFNELKEAVKECFDTEEEGEVNVAENKELEVTTEEVEFEEVDTIEEVVETEETTDVEETETEAVEEVAETEEFETVDYEAKYNDAMAEIATLKAEIEALTPYKLAAEKAERENAENEVFSKYDSRIDSMPEYAELKAKAGDYEIADLERECLILVGKFAMSETKTEDVEPETEPTITFALDETETEKKSNRYGNIYENYKTR